MIDHGPKEICHSSEYRPLHHLDKSRKEFMGIIYAQIGLIISELTVV
jgi:hypothetical protein